MKALGRILAGVLGFTAIILYIVGATAQEVSLLSLAAICAWAMALFAAFSGKDRNVPYIFFLLTFFIFLLSRPVVVYIRGGEIYSPFSKEVMTMVYGCLVVSLFGLTLGAATAKYRVRIREGRLSLGTREAVETPKRTSRINISLVQQLTAILTVVSGFATLLVVFERIVFWQGAGNIGDLRTSFSTSLPGIVLRLSYVYVLMLCIYLATLPEKRKCLPILLQYFAIGALRMLYGARSDFVISLMFLFVYFLIRDRLNEERGIEEPKWLGKRLVILALISVPLVVVLMVFVGSYRSHKEFQFVSFLSTLGDFLEAQGASFNVIGYTNIYRDQFPQPKGLYLFDRTYEFLTANSISSLFTGRHAYAVNTVERAEYGTSLGMTLYYRINPASYLAGYGCGSSYVAEAWLGYGYLGLFLINVFLARIMARLNEFRFDRLVPSTLWLIYLQSLFMMPRSTFDNFVKDFASFTHIFVILLLWGAYTLIRKSGLALPKPEKRKVQT